MTNPGIRRRAACVLTVAGVLWMVLPLQGSDALSTFRSQRYGYSVQYPSHWHPQILEDAFYIESFLPDKAVRAIRIPQGGFGIKILVPRQTIPEGKLMPRTLEEWVKAGVGQQIVLKRRTLEIGEGAQRLYVIEVTSQCCAVSADQESLEWYFEVQGRFFEAILIYWPGEPLIDRFRETLLRVALSLKVH